MSQIPLFQKHKAPELSEFGIDKSESQHDKTAITVIHNGMVRCSTKDCRYKNPDNTCSCTTALHIQNGQCDIYLESGKKEGLSSNG